MGRFIRLPAIIVNLILVAGLVFLWIMFAPKNIGGQSSYVILRGSSMEPKFHTGDLVIVRNASSYQVGDIVTYWDAIMGAHVMHRIVAIEQDRFALKGDNNLWIDTTNPVQADIVGKLWMHLPGLGKTTEWFRSPVNFALTMGLVGGLLMTSMLVAKSNKNKNQKKQIMGQVPNSMLGFVLYTFGFLSLFFLALVFYAFSRPLTRSVNNILYQQEGRFSYSATATPGLYDKDTVQPGEPIFPKLTCMLNVGYSYSILGSQVQRATGSHQLYARVADVKSGWQRTLPMTQETNFNGNTFFNAGTIDLCYVESLITLMKQETGLQSSTYTMEIVSPVAISANVSGEQVTETFVSALKFKFDEVHFYLETSAADENPLFFSQPGMSSQATLQNNTIRLLGLALPVQTVRILSVIGLLLTFSGVLAIGLYIYNIAQQSQEDLISIKYGSLLVDVYDGSFELNPPVIDVTSIDSLAKLAERHNTMILHISRNFLHDYLVQGHNATYRYSVSTGINNIPVSAPDPQAAYEQVFSATQSQYVPPRQPQQDFGYSNKSQSYYDLDDTQPTKAEPRMYRNG